MTGGFLSTYANTEKLYVFSVDFLAPTFNMEGLLAYIRDTRTITNWSYPTPGVFLLKSHQSAFQLSESLRRIIGGARCLVIEANAANVGGWLPKQAWDWFEPPAPLSTGLINSILLDQKKKS